MGRPRVVIGTRPRPRRSSGERSGQRHRAKASEVTLREAMRRRSAQVCPSRAHGTGSRHRWRTTHCGISLPPLLFCACAWGKEMDYAITQDIKRKYNLLIGERTLSHQIALGARPARRTLSMDVSGRIDAGFQDDHDDRRRDREAMSDSSLP